MEKLEPCGHCGGVIEVFKACGEWWWRCIDCHITSSGQDTKSEAIAYANHRASPWIKVSDGLPKDVGVGYTKDVLVLMENGFWAKAYYEYNDKQWFMYSSYQKPEEYRDKITHWQEINLSEVQR